MRPVGSSRRELSNYRFRFNVPSAHFSERFASLCAKRAYEGEAQRNRWNLLISFRSHVSPGTIKKINLPNAC